MTVFASMGNKWSTSMRSTLVILIAVHASLLCSVTDSVAQTTPQRSLLALSKRDPRG